METFFFMIVAAVAVLASILVITCKNPINSALSLILTFFCLATLYVTLDAPFMAAIQVLVYAGAIMVLIVFVIMLLNVRTESGRRSSHSVLFGSLIGLFTLFQLFYLFNRSSLTGQKGTIDSALINKVGHTELIGKALYTDFLLPFEVTSILLLVAIIGAVVLTKKKI
ncbi:NADH-quinone oxidoreductase subunit J [Geobacter hydrogenophilus]|uniref:NADH-quinone oxidoreductase subunit J n=1 Tax=Geobacter hydrogenophilus TaxID=40983 RepID=A0A9W6FZR3_9BACT|nr:NADH-quinone oxidoreductase subunit J [Geobacter hydrogenophilus]MBT0893465.1 NADH-quinone oxidoreductase subunit J [Geobacter hydrogenophilus]GLI37841.1 NADH dehydrogenase subunit J [Geobacter hydrogenophilus]